MFYFFVCFSVNEFFQTQDEIQEGSSVGILTGCRLDNQDLIPNKDWDFSLHSFSFSVLAVQHPN